MRDLDLYATLSQLDPSVATIIVTTLCTTVVGLLLQVLAYLREGRAHKWQVEQAELDRIHRAQINTNLTTKIDENTEISVSAFKEANDINRKIQAIGEMRLKNIKP